MRLEEAAVQRWLARVMRVHKMPETLCSWYALLLICSASTTLLSSTVLVLFQDNTYGLNFCIQAVAAGPKQPCKLVMGLW